LYEIKRKKVRVVRWRTKKIAEYELDTCQWHLIDAQIQTQFLPFSRSVYLPNSDFCNIGGLDETNPSAPHIEASAELISQVAFNEDENLYVPS
jgi:hypothetical protein